MFCGKCGNEMPDNSRFCTKCGAPLQEEAISENVTAPVKEDEEVYETYDYMYPPKAYTTNGEDILTNIKKNWKTFPVINAVIEFIIVMLVCDLNIWYCYGHPLQVALLGKTDYSKKFNFDLDFLLGKKEYTMFVWLLVLCVILYILYAMQIKIISGTPIAPLCSIAVYAWIIVDTIKEMVDVKKDGFPFECGFSGMGYLFFLFLILSGALKILMILREKNWR